MPSSELLSQFLYDNPDTSTSTNYTPIHQFGLEFQYNPTSVKQTYYNYANWFRHNDKDNIGSLPEPFFSDYILILTARAFGMDVENADDIQLDKLQIKD